MSKTTTIEGQHSGVTQEQFDSFQARHKRNQEFDAQKYKGVTENNLKVEDKEPINFQEQVELNYQHEKAIRPKGWTSSFDGQREAVRDATNRKEQRETELRKAHMLHGTGSIKFMWEQDLERCQPNIFLVLAPEYEITKRFSGAFTNGYMLQRELDIHSQDIYKDVLSEVNGMKKLTQVQKELSKELQQLIIATK